MSDRNLLGTTLFRERSTKRGSFVLLPLLLPLLGSSGWRWEGINERDTRPGINFKQSGFDRNHQEGEDEQKVGLLMNKKTTTSDDE